MLHLKLPDQKSGLRLLCLGAHCDDIEIGCGGTILKMIKENKIDSVKWVVFTSNRERSFEAKKSAEYFLKDVSSKEIHIINFKDGFLPYTPTEVKNEFEELKDFKPDLIFTHYRNDLHQDHRFISELTWNTFRHHFILEYEIPKYDADLGHPNFFVPLEENTAKDKVESLMEYYPTQSGKHWFDKETFFSLMRIRGLECASNTRFAEAFHSRKSVLN